MLNMYYNYCEHMLNKKSIPFIELNYLIENLEVKNENCVTVQ